MSDLRIERIPDPRGTKIARKGEGKGGGSGASVTTPHTPYTAPNTLVSMQTARILEVLSEGIVAGMWTATPGGGGGPFWNSVYLDGTPVADAANNFQFALTEGNFRYGYPSQDPIPGYPISEAAFVVGVTTTFAVPVVRQLSDAGINAVRYILQIPALYIQESSGDVIDASVGYAFDIQIDGGMWTNVVTERISGKTMSPYQRAVRVQLPYATTSIQIRVERLDATDESDQGISNTLIWSSYTEIIDGQIAYDDTCVISMTVNAQQFPTIPQRGYLLAGIMVEIPTNYNGWNHTYYGDWDGTFYVQWTNNPAWVLYALLTNTRWGLGRDLDVNAIDKWSFYDAAVSNDAGVPDGLGGGEVRWTCNVVINTRQDAWQVLTAVASSMLATLYFANGTVSLVQDRRVQGYERIFSPADVESGLFDYTGTDYRSRYNVCAVTWNDPGDSYNPAVELVQDQALVAQQGYREMQQTAFGCTSRGQAIRLGRWLIWTSQFETEVVTFQIGLENADLRPGDVIAISDPNRVGARLGGRVLDDQGANTITLDQSPDVMAASPTSWTIYVTVGSANNPAPPYTGPTVISLQVLAVLDNNQIQVAGKSGAIEAGSMWLARSGAVEATPWRVNSITDQGAGKYQVLATEYHVEKFDYVDLGVSIPPPSFSLIPTGPLLNASQLNDTEYIYLDATGWPQFGVNITWTPSHDPRVSYYQIEMSGPAGEYRRFTQVVGVLLNVPLMRQGPWVVTMVAFDNIGRRSQPLVYNFTPLGLLAKPLPPTALYITPQGGNLVTLTWTPTGEIDVVYYWIKYTRLLTGADWARATTSIARVDRNTTQVSTPLRAGTFMVKSIDSLGQESVSWAEAILQPQQTETSIFFDEAQQPQWAGDLGALWHHQLNQIWLPPPSAPEIVPPGVFPGDRGLAFNQTPTRIGIYDFDQGFDLGASTLVTMTGYVAGHGIVMGLTMNLWQPLAMAVPLAQGTNSSISGWVPLAIAVPLAMGSSQQWDAHIETSISQDGVTFGDWVPLRSTVVTGQAFQWRMIGTLYDLQTTLRAEQAGVIIEVPLRSVQGADVPLDGVSGQLTITYVAPFLVTPTVQLTARESVAPGGNILLTISDRDHFVVQGVDAAGAPHGGGAIDYFVQGYGGHA